MSSDAAPGRRRLQAVGRGTLRNLHPFGRRLRTACLRLLPDFVERRDHGFMDGGCAILAHALVEWSDGRLRLAAYALTGDPARVQHAVAIADHPSGPLVLDADGMGTDEDARRRLLVLEGVRCSLADFDPAATRIPWDERESRRLAEALTDLLPSPDGTPWAEAPARMTKGTPR